MSIHNKLEQIRESIEIHKKTIRDKQQQVKTLRSEIADLREMIKTLRVEYKKACFSTIWSEKEN